MVYQTIKNCVFQKVDIYIHLFKQLASTCSNAFFLSKNIWYKISKQYLLVMVYHTVKNGAFHQVDIYVHLFK